MKHESELILAFIQKLISDAYSAVRYKPAKR